MARGLVVGKFYPPHRGHRRLIEAALAGADEVHVVVGDRPGEDPPAAVRAGWLRELFPAAHVHLVEDRYDPADSALWAAVCRRVVGFAPDVVFTSEGYGDRFADCLGCRHVAVDRGRTAVPVSGTAVRADPLGHWQYLDPPVRGFYAARVVLVGAESTGKTTLAGDLAAAFGTAWVPEFGRHYWERKVAAGVPNRWHPGEFVAIARGQGEWEDGAARQADRVLICDTDAFATRVWYRRYLGGRSAAVDAVAAARRPPAVYLLTDPATPFDQDGTRDGERIRGWMHRTFVAELTAAGRPFVAVSGGRAERLARASDVVRRVLAGEFAGRSRER